MARRRHTPEQITGKLRELGWPWRRDSPVAQATAHPYHSTNANPGNS